MRYSNEIVQWPEQEFLHNTKSILEIASFQNPIHKIKLENYKNIYLINEYIYKDFLGFKELRKQFLKSLKKN